MDTKQLEKFAQDARRQLHEEVAARLEYVLRTDSAELRAKEQTLKALQDEITATSRDAVVEKVAYTWFNRFCALRYLDVNHYTRIGTVSAATSPTGEAFTQPEILQEAKQGYIDPRFAKKVDAERILGLLSGQLPAEEPQQEAYRTLLVGVCNTYHEDMPFMFESIDDYTELLMPDDLLSAGSILAAVREALTAENCADVEAIGWLYQFYISEKKDQVMGRKGKVPSEDIPAVTQLFTPHWIVRYMVENSLGRLWMLNHPDSRLVERMDYYIAPEEEITDFLRVRSPEELRLCDPAAGSGHILTYAFDLLYAIYEEQGYNPIDIPRLILERNLTGIEIDPRAGALAGFALMMKARARDRRFLSRGVQPDICVLEDVRFAPQELDNYMDAVGRDLLTQDVEEWLQQFEQATTFGSLIRPRVTDTAFIRERLDEVGAFQTLFLSHTQEKLEKVLAMTEALGQRYHVVVANPPYMGSRNQPKELKRFLKDQYKDFKSDLFSAFVVRNLELAQHKGQLGLMTPFVWMFISSYEDLRKFLIDHKTITSLVQLEYSGFAGATVPICTFTLENSHNPEYEGGYVRLSDFRGADNQAPKTREAVANPDCGWFYRASATDFKKIPGVPIAYWVSNRVRETFEFFPSFSDYADTRIGLITGDNAHYIRFWPEVTFSKIGLGLDRQQAQVSAYKWFPQSKGGSFRKWYGNHDTVLDWENNGYELHNRLHSSGSRTLAHNFNLDKIFLRGITWTKISSGMFGARLQPEGFLFNDASANAFPKESEYAFPLLGFLCSRIPDVLLKAMNPTLNYLPGNISDLPVSPDILSDCDFQENVRRLVELEKSDWDSHERSWDFKVQPLLSYKRTNEKFKNLLLAAYYNTRVLWKSITEETRHLEEKNNRTLISDYGLENDFNPSVPLSEITLTCNPHYRYGSSRLKTRNWSNFCERFPETCDRLNEISAELAPEMPEEDRLGLEQKLLDDTMREFISYAVGCMFGRYSLDKPGLILANQGETLDDYLRKVSGQLPVTSGQSPVDGGQWSANLTSEDEKLITDNRPLKTDHRKLTTEISFMPVADNVIPMLDGDWFPGDITARFKQFLRVTFGGEQYEENLAFIELALNRDIRGYFLRNFYKDHLKRYSKRPIYWLFSSPKGSFNALIYLHRYRPDTVSVVLNDYLREFRTKLEARKSHLERIEASASASKREKTSAVKEIAKIDKVLGELRDYEDNVLYPLAMEQLEIDLDDGVAVNYPKFGKALGRVRGLS